nr:DNA polymerase III subunit alpha [bacterium]
TRRPDGGCLPRRGELERAGFARAALAESGRLAAACDFRFDGSPPRLYPEGDVGVLRAACRDAFSRTMGGSEPGRVRLERELGVIERMGFAGYFLLAREIVVFAAERAIPWVGRGSAANSLVCYLLGITAVNPLEHGLYFERFLNEHRPDPPDIDIDFPTHRRREVIEFIRRRYGRERTALISTTSRFRGRGAFREAARVLGWREEKIREISRKLPYFFSNREPERLRREIPECRDLPWADSGFCRILTLAAALEGIPRNISVHPGGVVVSPRPLTDMVALERASGGLVVTQPDMYSIRDLGLVKVDILGQRALAVVEDTIRLEAARGTTLDWGTVKPREDEATGRLIATGRTLGCFYIESPVMRLLLRRLGCRDFETLVAASSIIRPGVNSSGLADRYIARSRGEEPVPRLHPLLAPILAETKGVMIYQEQVMRVVSAAAGMSMGDADLFRRAMNGKENMGVLEKRFRSGCRTTGFPEREIDALWGQIRSFAAYSFCKAHSAAFSVLSFQTAWLKAHYPASFLAAVISRRGGFYPSSEYIEEARRLGLEVLSPDVNHSEGVSISEGAGIRLGLMEVSGLGPEAIRRIVVARPRGGFSSWEDFIGRVRPGVAETRRLLSAGALDGLGVGRAELG